VWRLWETDGWQPAHEQQTYKRERANAHYDGQGHLLIAAIQHAPGEYSSARLRARGSGFLYGRFEALIQTPGGVGIWPAWWLLGPDHQYGWPECGEIDIMEAPASLARTDQVHQGVHCAHSSDHHDVAVGVLPTSGDWHETFHLYGIDWRQNRIDFFIDEIHTGAVTRDDLRRRNAEWPFDDKPQTPILSLAVGGWAGEPDGSWTTQVMTIEYARVSQ
jgi:beta-glucanase (GH16 family)